jgi:pimeloyl-ACP methyl ester carboxylesterase
MFRNVVFLLFFVCLTASDSFAQQIDQLPAVADPASAKDNSSALKQPARSREDWTKLPVDRAILKTLVNGASLGKADFPSYTRELLRFEWRHGDAIDVYLIKPKSVQKPRVVLYLYGFPADTGRFMDDGWCQRATREGLAAVGFESAMTGARFRNRPMKEWFVSELQESMGSTTHDVQLIIDYLAARKDLSADQVGIFGQGSGASIAILAAAADPRIAVLDLLNPWGDWPDWLKTSPVVPEEERAKYLTPEFLQKVSVIDPVAYLPQLKDRKLRVQQIMDDTDSDTPSAARNKIAAAAPQGKLVQYKDKAAHRQAWSATGLSGWIASQFEIEPQSIAAGPASKQP